MVTKCANLLALFLIIFHTTYAVSGVSDHHFNTDMGELNSFFGLQDKTIEVKSFDDLKDHKPKCNISGVSCLNCWTSLNCIDLGNGTFYPNLQYCPLGKSCINKTGICKSEGNYECSNQEKLQCKTEGVFPSPFNSIEYYTCIKGSEGIMLKFVRKCSPSYEFDSYAKLCRKKVTSFDGFSSLISICKYENETAPIKRNPNLFYRCEKDTVDVGYNLIPRVQGCPFDLWHDGVQCGKSRHSSLIGFDEKRCFENGLFAHPIYKRKYFECVIGQSPVIQKCLHGQRFDRNQNYCNNDYNYNAHEDNDDNDGDEFDK